MNYEAWCRMVLEAEGLGDWTITPGEAYCWIHSKTFTFDFVRYEGDYAAWLHEIAHAIHPYPEKTCLCRTDPNYYHGYHWSAKFTALVQKYMVPRA